MKVALDPKAELTPKRFEFRKHEASPFVVPVSENRDVPKENPSFLIELRGIPSAGSGGIEEFAYYDRIFGFRLVSGFSE